MQDENASKNAVSRRHSLQLLGAGLAVGGTLILEACKGNDAPSGGTSAPAPAANATPDDCSKDIDETSLTLRRTLQYKAKSDSPDKRCVTCAQFIADKYGACGGGCKLITGAIKPNGTCLSYAPSNAAAPAKVPT